MKAVILAAGKGTRLRPLTDEKSKAPVMVGCQMMLTHFFGHLRNVGVDEFVVVVGYLMDDIMEYYELSLDSFEKYRLQRLQVRRETTLSLLFRLMVKMNSFRMDKRGPTTVDTEIH